MLYEKIRELLAKQLEIDLESIRRETDIIEDLGADSLDIVELLMQVEGEYGLIIKEEGVGDLHTVNDVVKFVENLM